MIVLKPDFTGLWTPKISPVFKHPKHPMSKNRSKLGYKSNFGTQSPVSGHFGDMSKNQTPKRRVFRRAGFSDTHYTYMVLCPFNVKYIVKWNAENGVVLFSDVQL